MVNRSKPSWWKWSQRSYWYFAIGTNVVVIVITVSAFFLGFNERFPISTFAAIPILFFVYYSPKRINGYALFILFPAGVGSMTGLLVSLSLFEEVLIPGATIGFILGGIGGYLIGRRMKWNFPISPIA